LKAIVEEQETSIAAQPVLQAQRAQSAVWGASTQTQPKPLTIDTPSKSEGYPSCLDLAAEFIARG
jgi:hypothetical protein